MRNQFGGLLFAVVLVLAPSTSGFAQAGQRPDLSGVWQKATSLSAGDARWITPRTDPLPFQPWTQEIYTYGRNEQSEGEQFRPELNPRISECFPPDLHFLMSNDYPFEIVQSPERVLFLFEWGHWVRHAWLGQEPTDDVDVAWMGNSIGNWDGDTLVVETYAIDDRNSYAGFVHTDEMRITERLRRVDRNTLVNTRTFNDPKAYTMPWTDSVVYKLQPNMRITPRQQCDQTFTKEFVFHSD